ncbi:hypothetical protein Tco_1317403 [Tanacetum coccineum]
MAHDIWKYPLTLQAKGGKAGCSVSSGPNQRIAKRGIDLVRYGDVMDEIAEVAALSLSSFHKRYESSYETSSPSSSPALPSWKRYQGISELVEDTEYESSDSYTKVEGSKDEGPGSNKEAAPEGQHQEVPIMDTAADKPLGLGYGALRRHELTLGEGSVPNTFEIGQSSRSTPPSPEWSSGSLPVSPSSLVVPTLVASLVDSSPIASPATIEAESFLAELGA